MDSGLLFLTLSLLCFWLVIDDFVGNKKLTQFSNAVLPVS